MDSLLSPDEAAAQAAHKAKSAAAAVELSRELHQKELLGQTKEIMVEALREVFGKGDEGASGEMNILVRRIPFICNDIAQIHKDINTTATNIEKISGNINKGVWIILTAVLIAILKLVLIP